MRTLLLSVYLVTWAVPGLAQTSTLPAPGFHHLHLNSVDPEAAIDFYTRQFPSTAKGTFAGQPALQARKIWVLFTKVSKPPAIEPQTAYWHFGWNVVDTRKNLETYRQRKDVHLRPLYTGDGDNTVYVSSDTWPGAAGTLGRTLPQIAEAKAKGIQPTRVGGFAYMDGPDRATVEYAGNYPVERFNHVHMYQEDPLCAQLWYQRHLQAAPREGAPLASDVTETHCKVPAAAKGWPGLEREGLSRVPAAGVLFDDVAMNWYVNPGPQPLAPTRGHLADHVGLSVANLDAWMAKLHKEGVKFLGKPYKLGDSRAVMIEGPSREAIELVEVH